MVEQSTSQHHPQVLKAMPSSSSFNYLSLSLSLHSWTMSTKRELIPKPLKNNTNFLSHPCLCDSFTFPSLFPAYISPITNTCQRPSECSSSGLYYLSTLCIHPSSLEVSAMASAAEPSESLNYKTWVLKVSIHCEGCKRKVKRILKSIPGVYDAEVDARQHKVTVKTVVDAETLIKRLAKSGKHAALWPEKKPGNQSPGNGETIKKKEDKEPSVSKEPAESSGKKSIPSESSSASPAAATAEAEAKPKPPTEPAKPDSRTEEGNVNEPQTTNATKVDTSAQTPDKPAATVDEKASAAAEISSDKGGGEKKGDKAQKENSEDAGKDPDAGSINSSPPRHAYSLPAYPPPPPPAYVMSYNMAQPSASQAYYASPAPPASHGYVYMPFPPPPEFYYGSMDPSSPAPVQPAPHDNMFSDENPNACNIM